MKNGRASSRYCVLLRYAGRWQIEEGGSLTSWCRSPQRSGLRPTCERLDTSAVLRCRSDLTYRSCRLCSA